MTKTGPRGPLKQPRLGVVQLRVLVILLGVQTQREKAEEAFTGMPYRELHARLYHQAAMCDGQWLQTVYAQQLLQQGDARAANQLLLAGIGPIAAAVRDDLQYCLRADVYDSIEDQLMLDSGLETILQIQNTASLLQRAPADADQQELYTALLSLARQIALFVTPSLTNYQGSQGFLTLDAVEKASAIKAVNVQQASLSRALRGLLEHGLILQREILINRFDQYERRYFISEPGIERLRERSLKLREPR